MLPQLETFDPDDPNSVAVWIDLHQRRHLSYVGALAARATPQTIPVPNLTGQMTADWFQRNLNAHKVLATLVATPVAGSTLQLDVGGLHEPRTFRNWIRAHNLAHAQADQALGV
jgi:hypothetical protein